MLEGQNLVTKCLLSIPLYVNVNIEAEVNHLVYQEGGLYPGLIFVIVTSLMLPDSEKMNLSWKLICICIYTHTGAVIVLL